MKSCLALENDLIERLPLIGESNRILAAGSRAARLAKLLKGAVARYSGMLDFPLAEHQTVNAASEFDQFLTRWEMFGFSGGVLVLGRTKPVFEKVYGFSRWAERVPNTVDTLFPVASVTKQFTAAAILKLELDGKLLTSDPTRKYLGVFPGELGITTIHHLLTHTSGLIRSDTSFESSNSRDYVEKLKQAPRESFPGERYRYANGGYSLLAAIIEEVSGMSFQSYLRDQLFLPAGMQHTGFIGEIDFHDTNVARGHYIAEKQIRYALKSDSSSELGDRRGAKGIRPSQPVSCDWSIITSGGVVTTLTSRRGSANSTRTASFPRTRWRSCMLLTSIFPTAQAHISRMPGRSEIRSGASRSQAFTETTEDIKARTCDTPAESSYYSWLAIPPLKKAAQGVGACP
jgi:CubicO group peptidase (beta-lactamase class C family)